MTTLPAVHNTCTKICMFLGHLRENLAAGELRFVERCTRLASHPGRHQQPRRLLS
jgi:hypothetical protein